MSEFGRIKIRERHRIQASPADHEWSLWREAGLDCCGYNSEMDLDAINVFRGIVAKKFNTEIAQKLGLPTQYVELIQSIFCSIDWCNYGTSPRGCFVDPCKSAPDRLSKLEAWYKREWGAPHIRGSERGNEP